MKTGRVIRAHEVCDMGAGRERALLPFRGKVPVFLRDLRVVVEPVRQRALALGFNVYEVLVRTRSGGHPKAGVSEHLRYYAPTHVMALVDAQWNKLVWVGMPKGVEPPPAPVSRGHTAGVMVNWPALAQLLRRSKMLRSALTAVYESADDARDGEAAHTAVRRWCAALAFERRLLIASLLPMSEVHNDRRIRDAKEFTHAT